MNAILAIPSWVDESCLSDFPEEYQTLAAKIGFDNMLKLVSMYQGTSPYFPGLTKAICHCRNKRIKEEFTGANQKQLANKYSLTERYIYEILKKKGS